MQADQPCALALLPPGAAATLALDGGQPVPIATIQAQPNRVYVVRASP